MIADAVYSAFRSLIFTAKQVLNVKLKEYDYEVRIF